MSAKRCRTFLAVNTVIYFVQMRANEMKETMVVARIFLNDIPVDMWDQLELPDDHS
jgi:hypothetical protein